jgi:hypothetical protein
MEVAGDWERGDTSGDTLRRALQKGTSHVVTHAVLLRRGVCCCPRRRVAIKPFSALALRSVGLFRKAYPVLLKWQRVVPCRAMPVFKRKKGWEIQSTSFVVVPLCLEA